MTRNFRNSSNGCVSCRIEWQRGRFSRAFPWLAFLLATVSTLLSGLDWAWKVFLVVLWLFESYRAHQSMQGWTQGTLRIDTDGTERQVRIRGAVVTDFHLSRRSRWLVLRWRDAAGRRKALCLWPGDVSVPALRELRQAFDVHVDAAHTPLLST